MNRVAAFAKRVRPFDLPGFPILWIACLGAAGLMVVTGGFGTDAMPLAQRIGFWLLLMGWNAAKWQAWFAFTVREPSDWPRASLLATPLLNLPLPVEIALAARAVGITMMPSPGGTWLRALAISGVIVVVAGLLAWVLVRRRRPDPVAVGETGLLRRARVGPDALAAIQAEDHYCRVRTRDGASALVHYRFGDALAEIAALDGARVHRGAWVAAGAVLGAERAGRRWRLLLAGGGASVPVSATYAAEARRRQWLRPPPRLADQ